MAKKAKNTNNLIQKVTSWQVVIAIQAIASIALIALLFRLNALPMKYLLILIALVVLLCVGTFFLMKPSSKKGQGNVRNIVGKVVSLILSVLLLVGSLYIAKGNSVLDLISGANTQTTRMSLLVLNDSQYKEISDLKNQTIEVNNAVDEENMSKALDELKKAESSIKTNDVKDFEKMADDLYSGKTPAILVNQAYYINLEANHENFANETREIWHYDITETVKDISKNVDVTEKLFTIYISGIDTTGPVSTVSRSDVNMLVTVNPKTKQILMTSIPRDYYVTLANKDKKDKLTHAGLAGVENSVKTLENFLGIDINYYARVNFTSLIKMVDALDGITVNSPVAFTTMHGQYKIVKGDNQMDGNKALGFVRERYGLANGDNDRVKNQQRVLTAMLKKAMSPAIITNYNGILNSIAGSFETNMASGEITDLIQMQLNDMSSWDIHQIQLSGHGQSMTGGAYMPNNKLYYMIPDDKSVSSCTSLIKKMMNGEKITVSE
ncbi:LCP family protein [Candidatus Stoquefichus massiliensis]|uniref:LCP family protein n=1 Tax=Candidatus Stoquefichus massiliensis TaxID=1470350 RepID=UPI00048756A0|nr:LCP family protein [Candidatus Stoquefichus massiliensis]